MIDWLCIEGESCHPQKNMDVDHAALLALRPDSRPVLRFYHWQGLAATYGCLIHPEKYFQMDQLDKRGVLLGRRPTGGGVLFHHVDLAFSLLIPSGHPLYGKSPLDSYCMIHQVLLQGLQAIDRLQGSKLLSESHALPHERFCMAHPTIYDLLLNGRKVAGAAQRRMRQGLLHQGSLCLAIPDEELLKAVLMPSAGLLEAMQQTSCPLHLSGEETILFKEQFFQALANFRA